MNAPDVATFPATLGRAAFWPAVYPEGSCFCGQIPALFWLVETLRPATVLGLGLTKGDGYFALCQAIADLGMQSLAWGFGAWEGAVPDQLRKHNSGHYAAFSRLAQMPPAPDVASRFEDGLFDLILVDGRGLREGDGKVLPDLLQRLASPRGVVLLQGARAEAGDIRPSPAADVLEVLADKFAVLHFDAETNCALILTGTDPLPHLKAIVAAPDDEVAALDRLGASHLLSWKAQCAADEQAQQHAERITLAREAANLRALLTEQDGRLSTVTTMLAESQDLRRRDVHVLTVQLETLTEKLHRTRLEAEAALASSRREMEIAHQAATAELDAMRIRHFDESSDLQSEIFVLTKELDQARNAAAVALQALSAAEARMADLVSDLAASRAASAAAQAAHEDDTVARLQQIAELEQRLALRDQTCVAQDAQIAALRQDAVRRGALHQVQIKLRDWQQARLSEKPRLGGPPGPSGGKLADEVAALRNHPLFDAKWYQSAYPDTQDSGLPPAEHYLRHGFYEGRNPGPRLRLLEWIAAHPEVLAERKNPFLDPDLLP